MRDASRLVDVQGSTPDFESSLTEGAAAVDSAVRQGSDTWGQDGSVNCTTEQVVSSSNPGSLQEQLLALQQEMEELQARYSTLQASHSQLQERHRELRQAHCLEQAKLAGSQATVEALATVLMQRSSMQRTPRPAGAVAPPPSQATSMLQEGGGGTHSQRRSQTGHRHGSQRTSGGSSWGDEAAPSAESAIRDAAALPSCSLVPALDLAASTGERAMLALGGVGVDQAPVAGQSAARAREGRGGLSASGESSKSSATPTAAGQPQQGGASGSAVAVFSANSLSRRAAALPTPRSKGEGRVPAMAAAFESGRAPLLESLDGGLALPLAEAFEQCSSPPMGVQVWQRQLRRVLALPAQLVCSQAKFKLGYY